MTTIRPSELKVRCYAEREAPGVWVALCLDFDLAAQGETFEEAKGKLDAMIDDYVREAWDGEDQPYADALRYWLRFWWCAFWRRIRRHDDTHRPFNGRLPLSLAQ